MAKHNPITARTVWETALRTYQNRELTYDTEAAVDMHSPASADALEKYEEALEELLGLPAPDHAAVIRKLTIIWGELIWDNSPEASAKRRVIGDLKRLQFLAAGHAEDLDQWTA
jgi:hypothetical protein